MLDPYRAFVFPNRIRDQRRRCGLQKLMALSERLPEIPYIRLSKLERGEVFARADELHRIARALDIAPAELLADVTDPKFDIAVWAQPFQDGRAVSPQEERFAIVLAAALRALRAGDAALTIAALEKDFGLPPVILSRLENAHKTLDRWNDDTLAALCRLFGVADEAALRALVSERHRSGALDGFIGRIADPEARAERTRARTSALAAELEPATRRGRQPAATRATPKPRAAAASAPSATASPGPRMLAVFGAPLAGGMIAYTATGATIEAPGQAGARAFALRVCRATLGAGLPASAIVVADPDRAVAAGGLAAVRSAEGYRLVTVTVDRTGASKGYSVVPDLEIDLDSVDPADVIAVIAAVFP